MPKASSRRPSYLDFNKVDYAWRSDINYRKDPQKYLVGKGEQGVLICEPYKSEIGRHWKFKTPEIALISSRKILAMFRAYVREGDFIGADLARKFLQMGYTRSRRYANYRGGRKYNKHKNYSIEKIGSGDPSKALSANIFHVAWKTAEKNKAYQKAKIHWKENYG